MKKNLRLLLMTLLCAVFNSAWAVDVTDVLTRDDTGATNQNYISWSNVQLSSGAVYAGQSAGGNESIQIRSNNSNSGIITTASSGKARSIVVTWNVNTNSGRKLNIYGSNTAYTNPTDLYNESTQGTLIGSMEYIDQDHTVTELEITDDYAFIGIRSNSGAMYLEEIEITWETDGTVAKLNANLSATDLTITEGETKEAAITTESDGALSFDSDNTAVATVSASGTVTAVAPGTATITVKQDETETYNAGETTFNVTVLEYVEPGTYPTVSVPYEIDFTASQGQFVIEPATSDLGFDIWTHNSTYGMKATTYVNGTNHDGESWLVSPLIDLTEASEATLIFYDQVNKFFNNINEEISINIREEDGDWEDLSIIYEKPTSTWSGWKEHNIDLSAFVGSKIQVGIHYIGYATGAGTYEIKSFKVVAETVVEKQEAGLKFSESSYNATIGEENTFPTLENPNNLTVTWSSSNENAATVDASGNITLVAPGNTTIKVTSEENDEFLAGSASYQLIVTEKAIAGTEVFELVTDASTLAAGDEIILVNADDDKALSTTQNGNNRSATDVTLESDGTIIPSNIVQVITLEGEEDSWLLNVGELGYLYAPSTTSNQLKSQTTASDNAKATITIATDGTATVQFNPSAKDLRNVIRYNPNGSNPIFSCYASTATTGTLVRIYRNTTGKLPAGLTYSETTCTATIGEDNVFPTLSNPNGLDVTYASSDDNVATIDAEGVVTLVAAGTATITASSEENDEYKAGSASYTLTVVEPVVPQTDNDNVYELVTDDTTLAAGDVIILVGLNVVEAEEDGEEDTYNYYGLGTKQKTNNREAVTVTYNEEDNTVTGNNYLQEITLEAAESNWLFNVGNGYLYAANSKSNWLKTEAEADDNAKATIAISGEEATIIFQGENTRNNLRFNYNNGTPLFSAYDASSTTGTLAQIYRKVVAPVTLKGDVNGDGSVSIQDVSMTAGYVVGSTQSGFIKENADMNGDNDINIADVMEIVGIIIGK